MERPADDIFGVRDINYLRSPMPRHLFSAAQSSPLVPQSGPLSPSSLSPPPPSQHAVGKENERRSSNNSTPNKPLVPNFNYPTSSSPASPAGVLFASIASPLSAGSPIGTKMVGGLALQSGTQGGSMLPPGKPSSGYMSSPLASLPDISTSLPTTPVLTKSPSVIAKPMPVMGQPVKSDLFASKAVSKLRAAAMKPPQPFVKSPHALMNSPQASMRSPDARIHSSPSTFVKSPLKNVIMDVLSDSNESPRRKSIRLMGISVEDPAIVPSSPPVRSDLDGSRAVNNSPNPNDSPFVKRKRGRPPKYRPAVSLADGDSAIGGSMTAARSEPSNGIDQQVEREVDETLATISPSKEAAALDCAPTPTNVPRKRGRPRKHPLPIVACVDAKGDGVNGQEDRSKDSKGIECVGDSMASMDLPPHKTRITLHEWSMSVVPNSPKLTGVAMEELATWIVLVGRRVDIPGECWHSSIVTERVSPGHICTGSGRSLYVLDGAISREEMHRHGFSDTFIGRFADGFPPDWRSVVTMELQRLASPSPLPGSRKESRKEPTKKEPTDIAESVKRAVLATETAAAESEKALLSVAAVVEELTPRKRGRPRKAVPVDASHVVEAVMAVDPVADDDASAQADTTETKAEDRLPVKKRGPGRPRKHPLSDIEGFTPTPSTPTSVAVSSGKKVKKARTESAAELTPKATPAIIRTRRDLSLSPKALKREWGGKVSKLL